MEEWTAFAKEAQAFPWVRAIEVFLLSVLAAKIISVVISRVLLRLTLRTDTDLDDQLIELLHRPVFVSVILIGLTVAVQILGWSPEVEHVLNALIQTVAIFVWTGAAFRLTSTTLTGLSRLANRVAWLEARTLPLFDNVSKIIVFGASMYFLLVTWNLDLSAWLASAGIVGIAVGFAAKDSLANLFGGIFVIMDAPYKIGDFINLDTGERGQVVKIGLRSTRLLTRDDVEITLPNSHIANAKVVNESGGPYEKTRVVVTVGVAYGSDVDQVRATLISAATSVEHVLSDPPPRIRFVEMGDSALIFRVQGWIDEPSLRGECVDGLNTAIYKALAAAKIEIPFPQRVVHMASTVPTIPTTPASTTTTTTA